MDADARVAQGHDGTDGTGAVVAHGAAPARPAAALPAASARPFEARRDLAEYSSWLRGHGLPPPDLRSLPVHGAIVDGMAAAFLYRTDSDIAFIDGLATNPAAPLRARCAAAEAAVVALMDLARRHGFKKVISYPGATGVQRMAARLGARTGQLGVMVAKAL